MLHKDYALLVSSCDAYRDLWQPYFTLLDRYWPVTNRPAVYLVTESSALPLQGVNTLHSHLTDRLWTPQLAFALKQISEPWVLLSLEDFFLRAPVPVEALEKLKEYGDSVDAHMIRLVARPGPSQVTVPELRIGTIDTGARYRVSTQAALWRRTSLLSLIESHRETIWEFEHLGSARSDRLFPSGFYAVERDLFPYRHHVIEKGRWFPWEARRFHRLGIGVDLHARPTMTPLQSGAWLLKKGLSLVAGAIR